MTAAELAALHKSAMRETAAWSETDFRGFLEDRQAHLHLLPEPHSKVGFALSRIILDEAELLMIAVHPEEQNCGRGKRLMKVFEAKALQKGAHRLFLEVAESNRPARALYSGMGWQETGRRKAYYHTENGRVDAILMSKSSVPA